MTKLEKQFYTTNDPYLLEIAQKMSAATTLDAHQEYKRQYEDRLSFLHNMDHLDKIAYRLSGGYFPPAE